MRKIRLSDTDLELFDIEVSPSDYNFYQKHKDAFRTMWREQGTPFWTRFVITFRSFTVKHGVIKQMNIDSPKFQNLIDQAFINIQEEFVHGTDKIARNFIEDIARLAQHQDKLPALDSKSFAKDPFYARDTRELFRQFFGKPDQRSSYLKVYLLSPVFLRFGGSVCRCLVRWVDAPPHDDPADDSYWIKPQEDIDISAATASWDESTMCPNCMDDSGTRFFKEKINGCPKGPVFIECWILGDPRFNDSENPLFAPHLNPSDDWRETLTVEKYRNFLQFAKLKYTPDSEQCKDCKVLRQQKKEVVHVCGKNKKKKKKLPLQDEFLTEIKLLRESINRLEVMDCISRQEYHRRIIVMEDVQEVENQDKTISTLKVTSNPNHNKTKSIFTNEATMTNDFQCGLLSYEVKSSMSDVVSGFRVFKIEDEKNGLYEVNISAASSKNENEKDEVQKGRIDYKGLNKFIVTSRFLREKLEGLPNKLEWWEGCGFCVAILNYEDEEKKITQTWTNFTLKVAGFQEKAIKKIMISLLLYVAKRKRRICHGWNMGVDDVVACILPEATEDLEGLTISIQRGFRFQDRLTDDERKSLSKHQNCKMKDILWDKMITDPNDFDFFCLENKEKGHESSLNTVGLGANGPEGDQGPIQGKGLTKQGTREGQQLPGHKKANEKKGRKKSDQSSKEKHFTVKETAEINGPVKRVTKSTDRRGEFQDNPAQHTALHFIENSVLDETIQGSRQTAQKKLNSSNNKESFDSPSREKENGSTGKKSEKIKMNQKKNANFVNGDKSNVPQKGDTREVNENVTRNCNNNSTSAISWASLAPKCLPNDEESFQKGTNNDIDTIQHQTKGNQDETEIGFNATKHCDKTKQQSNVGYDREATGKSNSLKVCSNCNKKEPSRKVFKKCQKCKEEDAENTRYYCSRECQLTDWKLKHKLEHKNKV